MKMYSELARWFPLLTPPEEYADEAPGFLDLFARAGVRSVLELGSGGGHLASHLKHRFTMTLSDPSEEMLAVSRLLNPECQHVVGDMRTLRLDRAFDGVLIHDAVMYMVTEADLVQALATAAAHLETGGTVVIAPDHTAETFRESTEHGGSDRDGASVRYLEWTHDPRGTTYEVDYVIVTREPGQPAQATHDHHVEGLFPIATWLEALDRAGFDAREMPDPVEPGRVLFVGTRRGPRVSARSSPDPARPSR